MKPFIRTAYNYDMSQVSKELGTVNEDDLLTDQSSREDADINVIVRRFGVLPLISNVPLPPTLSEFTDVFDFQSAMNRIREAEESFGSLSADTRARFANDPQKFVQFCSEVSEDGKSLANLEEMRKLGLAVPKKPDILPPEPQRVQIVNPEALVPKPTNPG